MRFYQERIPTKGYSQLFYQLLFHLLPASCFCCYCWDTTNWQRLWGTTEAWLLWFGDQNSICYLEFEQLSKIRSRKRVVIIERNDTDTHHPLYRCRRHSWCRFILAVLLVPSRFGHEENHKCNSKRTHVSTTPPGWYFLYFTPTVIEQHRLWKA